MMGEARSNLASTMRKLANISGYEGDSFANRTGVSVGCCSGSEGEGKPSDTI